MQAGTCQSLHEQVGRGFAAGPCAAWPSHGHDAGIGGDMSECVCCTGKCLRMQLARAGAQEPKARLRHAGCARCAGSVGSWPGKLRGGGRGGAAQPAAALGLPGAHARRGQGASHHCPCRPAQPCCAGTFSQPAGCKGCKPSHSQSCSCMTATGLLRCIGQARHAMPDTAALVAGVIGQGQMAGRFLRGMLIVAGWPKQAGCPFGGG